MGKAFLFISGKGGVGKSTLAAALAVASARTGARTALVDGDIGLRSLDMMLGLQDKAVYELTDVAGRTVSLEDALVRHPEFTALWLLVGGQQARPKDVSKQDLKKIVGTLKKRFDLVLLDGPAGLGRGAKNFLGIADEVVVVATPDQVATRAAEKTASWLYGMGIRPWLALNRVRRDLVLRGDAPQPGTLAQALDLPLLGVLEENPALVSLSANGMTAAQAGDTRADEALSDMLSRMAGEHTPVEDFAAPRLNIFQKIWAWLED
ncbi:MAG TPA: P-loop NTPase [Candidatus Limnocylindria bacterium]|nr:P-loop NTPase [Candidatus Limnocylindria bacterium]